MVYLKQWKIKSSSNPKKHYTVSVNKIGKWFCSCPGWKFHTPRKDCRHILSKKQTTSLAQLRKEAA